MAHPKMYSDDDPMLTRLRELALSFPSAAEKVSHGIPAFYTKKIFAYYGGSERFAKDDWVPHRQSVIVRPADDAERTALLELPRGYHPAYLGPHGWVGVDLDGTTDWDEVHELLDASFRLTAGKRLITQLDQSR